MEMKIISDMFRGIASKALTKAVKAKTGYSIELKVNAFNAFAKDGRAHVHLDIDADMTHEELKKILASVGLG